MLPPYNTLVFMTLPYHTLFPFLPLPFPHPCHCSPIVIWSPNFHVQTPYLNLDPLSMYNVLPNIPVPNPIPISLSCIIITFQD